VVLDDNESNEVVGVEMLHISKRSSSQSLHAAVRVCLSAACASARLIYYSIG
jgi:hypothetical protein